MNILKSNPKLTTFAVLINIFIILLAYLFYSFSTSYIYNLQSQYKKEILESLSSEMADKLDKGMFERYRDVEILSTLNEIKDTKSSVESKRLLLEELQSTFKDYAFIGLADVNGKVIASTGKLLEGEDVSQRPWFIEAKKGNHYAGDVHEALLLAKLLPNLTGEPLRFVDFSIPVKDNKGNIIYILGAHLSWTWANEVRDSTIKPLEESNKSDIYVLDSDGTVLLGETSLIGKKITLESMKNALNGQTGSTEEIWNDGEKYLTGYAPTKGYRNYPGLGWVVYSRQKLNTSTIDVDNMKLGTLVGGLILLLIVNILLALIFRSIIKIHK